MGRARLAVTLVFALNGLGFSSWYARLPDLQDELGAGTGALGLALLGAPLGLLVAQPLAGAVVARRGSRRVLATAPLAFVVLVLPAVAGSPAGLFAVLLVVGAGNGALDVTMNVQGVAVERAAGRRLFSSLHAAFSFGALAGALSAAAVAAAGVEPLAHLAVVAAATAAAVAAVRPWHVDDAADAEPGGPVVARPTRALLALGAVAFAALIAEGAVFDWSAIHLEDELGAGAGVAPLGLAAFSLTMGAGRLAADGAADRLGPRRVVAGGLVLAAAGYALVVAASGPALGIAGFLLAGAGLAALFPLTLRAADDAAPGPSLAAVATVGYVGIFAGPPLIGLLAEPVGLRLALLAPLVLLLAALPLARAVPAR